MRAFRLLVSVAPFAAIMALAACSPSANETVAPPAELATGPNPNTATAILNAGVMAELGGETASGTRPVKLLFDPLYDDHWGTFEVPPPELVEALVTGAPPYDGVAAVFVSHAHGDHFSPAQLTAMLAAQPDLVMVAPTQALDRMREAPGWDEALSHRIRTIELANGEAAEAITIAGATVEAFRSPHTGWPDRHAEIHNITFRVSAAAADGLTARVMHLGDADPGSEHYKALAAFLQSQRTSLAMVPYWHYAENGFDALLEETFNARSAVAMHVPVEAPGYLARGTRPFFTEVGQMVEIVPVR